MARMFNCLNAVLILLVIALPGCTRHHLTSWIHRQPATPLAGPPATDIEYPDVKQVHADPGGNPLTIHDAGPREYWDLSLQEAVQITLQQSKVLRDLGGSVLQSPDNKQTVYSPAVTETDPRFGVEAALSAFDAAFSTSAFFEKNDRQINNSSFPPNNGGVGKANPFLKQDLIAVSSDITKKSATGTEYTMRHTIDYDYNNSPLNLQTQGEFGGWDVALESEVRHPLLRGGGIEYNRVVGPNGSIGAFNGVLIARINSDISLAEFEIGVRNLISDVENAYWELYFAYRDLDAKIAARARALETWRRIHALYTLGRQGGEAAKEAQAREQYFRLEEDVQNALTGKVIEKSASNTFRGLGGVHANERRLRLIMGIPTNDGRLIRPSQDPVTAKVSFTWDEAVTTAMMDRSELRRQQWRIKRRELELNASRQFLLPQLDAVGRHRWRGYGRNLLNSDGDADIRDNAYEGLLNGGFQEWQLGFELSYPVGFRQAHAQIRNAQLNLAREVAVLETQELEIVHDLASAFGEIERSYTVAQTNYNRRLASKQQLEALEAAYDTADENQKARLLDLLLDAQRRLADAESRFYRSLAEYSVAIKQVHFHQGSLLTYNGIQLSEGRWRSKAYGDAGERERRRHAHWNLTNYIVHKPLTVSSGRKEARAPSFMATLPGQQPQDIVQSSEAAGAGDAVSNSVVNVEEYTEEATQPNVLPETPGYNDAVENDVQPSFAPIVQRPDDSTPPGGSFQADSQPPAVRAATRPAERAATAARVSPKPTTAEQKPAEASFALPPRIEPVRRGPAPVIDRAPGAAKRNLTPTTQGRSSQGVVKSAVPPKLRSPENSKAERVATVPSERLQKVQTPGVSALKTSSPKPNAVKLAPLVDRRSKSQPALTPQPTVKKLAPLIDRKTQATSPATPTPLKLTAPPAPSFRPTR